MKLTYWIADCLGDRRAYSARARATGGRAGVVIEYRDAFDLMEQLTGEGGGEGSPETERGRP